MGGTQKNWVTCQNDQSPHLKYHHKLKTKMNVEGGESQFWRLQENTVNKGRDVMQV